MDVVCATKIWSYQYHAHKQSHLRPPVHAHHDLEYAVAICYSWLLGFTHPKEAPCSRHPDTALHRRPPAVQTEHGRRAYPESAIHTTAKGSWLKTLSRINNPYNTSSLEPNSRFSILQPKNRPRYIPNAFCSLTRVRLITRTCILIVYTYEPDNARPPLCVGSVHLLPPLSLPVTTMGPTKRGGLALSGSYV